MNQYRLQRLGIFVVALLLSSRAANGDVVLSYEFTGESLAPTFAAPNLTTASNFGYDAAGSGGAQVFIHDSMDDPSITFIPPSGDPQVAAGGWSPDGNTAAFYFFTVGSTSGIDLDSLEFYGFAGNATNDLGYRVDMRIGGGSFTTVGSGSIPESNSNTAYQLQQITLSIMGVVDQIDFRIYGLDYAPNSSFRIDDVRLIAQAVPEGSALLYVGIPVLGLLVYSVARRRIV